MKIFHSVCLWASWILSSAYPRGHLDFMIMSLVNSETEHTLFLFIGLWFPCVLTPMACSVFHRQALQFFSELNKLRQEETGGTIPIWHALKIPLFLTRIYSLMEDQRCTNLVLRQRDILKPLNLKIMCTHRIQPHKLTVSGDPLALMSLYPYFALLWILPISYFLCYRWS